MFLQYSVAAILWLYSAAWLLLFPVRNVLYIYTSTFQIIIIIIIISLHLLTLHDLLRQRFTLIFYPSTSPPSQYN